MATIATIITDDGFNKLETLARARLKSGDHDNQHEYTL